jgi:hypothetical protein
MKLSKARPLRNTAIRNRKSPAKTSVKSDMLGKRSRTGIVQRICYLPHCLRLPAFICRSGIIFGDRNPDCTFAAVTPVHYLRPILMRFGLSLLEQAGLRTWVLPAGSIHRGSKALSRKAEQACAIDMGFQMIGKCLKCRLNPLHHSFHCPVSHPSPQGKRGGRHRL